MDMQARTGDTVLVDSREMTGRTQTLPWWLQGDGGKQNTFWPRCWIKLIKGNREQERKGKDKPGYTVTKGLRFSFFTV
jgi:hypothetical protein